ncbi:MAG: ComEC/Rec2 family competence protein [Leptospira sp.]|nr:ComEC/Rec2 family competence protein [Leptospira sp.]
MGPGFFPKSRGAWFCFGVHISGIFFKIFKDNKGFEVYSSVGIIFLLIAIILQPIKLSKHLETISIQVLVGFLVFTLIPKLDIGFRKKNINPGFKSYVELAVNRIPLTKLESLVVKGFVFGSIASLPYSWKQRTKRTGLLHLFAASGLHLGIFVGSFYFLFSKIFQRIPIVPLLASIGFGFFYLYLLDFPVSFLRAFIFAVYTMFGSYFHRKIFSLDLILYASANILLFQFSDFLSIGYCLSFAAVWGIFFIKPKLDLLVFPKSKIFIKENLHITLSCSISTFPFLVFFFKSYAFGGIIINFFLVPLSCLLLPIVYGSLFLGFCFSFLSTSLDLSWLWLPIQFLLSLFLGSIPIFESIFPYFREWKEIPYNTIFLFLLFYTLVFYSIRFVEKNVFRFVLYFFIFFSFVLIYLDLKSYQAPIFNSMFQRGLAYIQRDSKLWIYGNCFKRIHLDYRDTLHLEEVFIESESCLRDALSLKNIQPHIKIQLYHTNAKLWGLDSEKSPIEKRFSLGWNFKQDFAILRFDGKKEKIPQFFQTLSWLEKRNTHKTLGIIVLDFPKWKQKEEWEWKKYQNLLGISSRFQILTLEEIIEGPLFNEIGNRSLP